MDANTQNREHVPIAIVGFSSIFPGEGADPESFWKMLLEKRSAMTEAPEDRVNMKGWHYPETGRPGRIYARGGNYIREDVSLFDAPFFSLSANEASAMDPQQRHLLEVTYHALENAGIPIEKLSGSQTSVHVGCLTFDYRHIRTRDLETTSDYDSTGISNSMIANRISWFYDCRGTSILVDTACSSSLVALDMACQGLQRGEAEMGIVAGSNLMLSPDSTVIEGHATMLSPDSTSYSFDHRANGFSRGEGTATIIIKRLNDAVRDGDTIRAVIRSTGSNNNGHASLGIMQPKEEPQIDLIRRTYAKAGLATEETQFCEAHGTGTVVGDSIEMNALGQAFRSPLRKDNPLIVGAVKSNIGHLEGAAGLAGLIKTVMALEKGVIPPNINFERFSDKIKAVELGVKVPLTSMPWPTKGLRRASVNSFGIGGSNAHAVLDDALSCLKEHNLVGNHLTIEDPELDTKEPNNLPIKSKQQTPKLLTFSAKDKSTIKRLSQAYKDHFKGKKVTSENLQCYFSELAFTLNSRRSLLPCRGYLVANSVEDLQDMTDMASTASSASVDPRLGFAFTGQGALWRGMGEQLLAYPLFKNRVMTLDAELNKMGTDWSLLDIISDPTIEYEIDGPIIAQTANTALQVALTDLYRACDIIPSVVIGHSSGEIGAAYACGALSDIEALKIAYTRGVCISHLLSSQEQKGGMIAVGLSEQDARTFIAKVKLIHREVNLTVACINGPTSVTISGDSLHIDTLRTILDGDRIFARRLNVPAAYHSPQMEAAVKPYKSMLSSLSETTIVDLQINCLMVSSVTGKPVSPKVLRSGEYWCDNLLNPVRFWDAFTGANESHAKGKKPSYVFLEIGPHSVLKGPISSIRPANSGDGSTHYVPSLVRNQDAMQTFLSSAGRLHCLGLPVSLETVNGLDESTQKKPKAVTDLPAYPFDHSKSYWRESRISKRFRTADQPHHDLLGKPISDWNASEAQWRNFIKVAELPWLEDHVVGGTLIYPAAGMMVMAIEAAKQIAEQSNEVAGFMLKDVKFMQAMVIPDGPDGLETKVHIRKRGDASSLGEWAEFRIFSYGDESWREHCTGFIRQEYSCYNEVDGGGDDLEALCREHEERAQRCVRPCDKSAMYKCLNDNGFGLGPAFQTVTNARYNDQGDTVANIDVYQWPERLHPQPHIIHPTTLDGILQITMAAITDGGSTKIPTAIPTSLRKLWVATKGLACPTAGTVLANGHIEALGRGYGSRISALSSDLTTVLLKAEGLQSTSISSNSETSSVPEAPNSSCLNVKLLPAIQFMNTKTLNDYCLEQLPKDLSDPADFYQDVSFIVLKFLLDALKEVGDTLPSPSAAPAYLQRFLGWALLKQKAFHNHEAPLDNPAWPELLENPDYVSSVCERVASFNAEGYAFVKIGQALPGILRGEMDPLQFLYKDDLLANFYEEWNNSWVGFHQCEAYLELLAHRNPEMKIMEIGAGTGGTTRKVLHGLSTKVGHLPEEALYKSYEYTDISAGFFEKAEENFGYFPRMSYRVFDVEKPATKQNFEVGTYDLVIAGSVLHATHDIASTMRNVRSLLKTGGKLIMLEPVHPEVLRGSFLGGLMEGWWTNDPNRPWNPTLTTAEWNEYLKSADFTGVDTEFPDHLNPRSQESSIIITEAVESPVANGSARGLQTELCFVGDIHSSHQMDLCQDIQGSLALGSTTGGAKPAICSLEQCASRPELHNTTVIFLCDLEKAILQDLNEEGFTHLRNIVGNCKNILWVSGGGGKSFEKPECSIVDGWARSLRSERPTRRLIVMKLDSQNGQISSHQVSHLTHMLKILVNDSKDGFYEPEVVEIDQLLHVPRVRSNALLKDSIFSATSGSKTEMKKLGDIGEAKLSIGQCGLLDTLRWTTVLRTQNQDELLADEVEIKVKAVGLNFKDCLSALGRVPETNLGLECAGVVSRAGVDSNFSPGDRVITYGAGVFKTFVRAQSSCVCRIPDGLDLTQAAAIPTQFVTAWRVIKHIGRLQKGESILIHSGAGGTGQAAIQIAQHVGAEIFATVGSAAKKELLMSEYNIPADHIFYSRNANFADSLMRRTNGRGVDVVMNSLAGPILTASWECIAAQGRFVEIGLKDILSNSGLPMAPFARNATFTHFEGSFLTSTDPSLFRGDIETLLPLFTHGILHVPRPLHVLTVDKVEDAFRSLQKGTISGKVVLTMDPSSLVPALLEGQTKCQLSSDATYMVVGGLGGLGRRISRWLVSRGARNLVLVGRSGGKSAAARQLLVELDQSGVRAQAVSCDIVSLDAVQSLVQEVEKTMPPIRGCVQAAMVLRDRMFQDMTLEDWELSINCKVMGSRNLTMSLPTNLDFFVMLSSCSALIGPPGQANYSAANSYLDALARHLVFRGRKAISLDLGVMRDDGFLAEDPEFMKQVLTYGALETLTREDFFAILDYYCSSDRSLLAPDFAQVAIGVPFANSTGKLAHLVQEPPIFLPLRVLSGSQASSNTAGLNGTKTDYRTLLKDSDSLENARQVMLSALVEKLDKICVFSEGDLESDMHRPLTKLGVDSLVAVELGNWLKRYFEADVAVFELMGEETLSSLSLVVAQRSQLSRKS